MPWGLLFKAGPWLALALAGVVIWGLWGRLEGANLKLAAAETVIQQREDDMKLSAVIVAQQAQALSNLQTKVVTQIERIYAAPITRACVDSPAMRASTLGVRDIILPAGGSPAGREPSPTVR